MNDKKDRYASRGPIDLRLIQDAKTSPKLLAIHAANALLNTAEVVLVSLLIGYIVEGTIEHKPPSTLFIKIAAVIIILVIRAFLNISLYSRLLSLKRNVAQELSSLLLQRLCSNSPQTVSAFDAGMATSQGIIEMSSYLSQFLADFFLALILSPIALLTLLVISLQSFLLVAITLVTVPPLMVLLGKLTLERSKGKLESINYLSGRFLDLMTGLPTLCGLGLARNRSSEIRVASENYRKETTSGLKVALLSGAALDLLGTLATAFVAISVGNKLLSNEISIHFAVTSILLVPAIYAPLRAASSRFHASTDARLATDRFYGILRDTLASSPYFPTIDDGKHLIKVRELVLDMQHDVNRPKPSFTFSIPTKGLVCIDGPSGSGKSTLLRTLSGATTPLEGEIHSADDLRLEEIAFLPQTPQLVTGTIRDNLTLTTPLADQRTIEIAVEASCLGRVFADNFWNLDTPLSENGIDLSAGERQRVAIARILLQDKRIYLLDEPTANLDKETELQILRSLTRLAQHSVVVIATHSDEIKSRADLTISTTTDTEYLYE